MIVERRLELEPVDGVTMYVLENSDYDRRWQLRRGGEVVAETGLEDHERARRWISALQGGQVPETTPETELDSQPPEVEMEQLGLVAGGQGT